MLGPEVQELLRRNLLGEVHEIWFSQVLYKLGKKNGIEQQNPAIAKSAKFIISVASIAVKALLAYRQYIQGVKSVP